MTTSSSQTASEFLTDPTLLRDLAYVNGKWVQAESESSFAVEGEVSTVRAKREPFVELISRRMPHRPGDARGDRTSTRYDGRRHQGGHRRSR